MKQPNNTMIYNTALYLRLSRDDELQGESGSIQTQRMMLRLYAEEHGLLANISMMVGLAPTLTDRAFNG